MILNVDFHRFISNKYDMVFFVISFGCFHHLNPLRILHRFIIIFTIGGSISMRKLTHDAQTNALTLFRLQFVQFFFLKSLVMIVQIVHAIPPIKTFPRSAGSRFDSFCFIMSITLLTSCSHTHDCCLHLLLLCLTRSMILVTMVPTF
jgi:hypothetical protein